MSADDMAERTPDADQLLIDFNSASLTLQGYLQESGPLSPGQVELLSLTVEGLQTELMLWKGNMANSRKSSDVNVTAFEILNSIIGEPPALPIKKKRPPAQNPAAVSLGRLGGLNGGKTRAAKFSAMRRAQIAQKAAKARWDIAKNT